MKSLSAVFVLVASAAPILVAADFPVLDSMDTLSFRLPKEKCAVELVDGKTGKAERFAFAEKCSGVFAVAKFRGTADWDRAAGISFWVKGDGSPHCGGIQLIWNDDYAVRYGYAFPIDKTEWTQVVIPWRDFVPELSNDKNKPLGPDHPPSKISAFAFGKWWYWRDYAAHSYAIADIRLESTIDTSGPDYKPVGSPLARVAEKLKTAAPVTVVTMGDSLTDFNHWANKPVNWPTLLKEKLTAKYKSAVTLVNPALGGTELRQNLVLLPHWLNSTPHPELVTICFGGNDWNSGIRGESFRQVLTDAVDRVRRATHGTADVLLMTTCRGLERWETYSELAEAARAVAKDRNTGLADIYDAFGKVDAAGREKLFCRDKTHLGPDGHELLARMVLEAIEGGH
jgi:lysophospholipase L1-like esterase